MGLVEAHAAVPGHLVSNLVSTSLHSRCHALTPTCDLFTNTPESVILSYRTAALVIAISNFRLVASLLIRHGIQQTIKRMRLLRGKARRHLADRGRQEGRSTALSRRMRGDRKNAKLQYSCISVSPLRNCSSLQAACKDTRDASSGCLRFEQNGHLRRAHKVEKGIYARPSRQGAVRYCSGVSGEVTANKPTATPSTAADYVCCNIHTPSCTFFRNNRTALPYGWVTPTAAG